MRLQHFQGSLRLRLASIAIAGFLGMTASQSRGANIAWVTFHPADNMPSTTPDATSFGTMAPDVGYTQLLTAAGHTVTRVVTVNNVDTTTLGATLNTFDLVIIGRSVDSAHYQTDAETAVWNTTITKPMITMSGFVVRNSRLGFMDVETLPDSAGPVKLKAAVPGHPIFAGISLAPGGTMVNDYTTAIPAHPITATAQRGFSANLGNLDAGGTLIATVDTVGDAANGGVVIAEWPAGAVITNVNTNTTDTLGGRRMMFNSGTREQASGGNASFAGILDLTADGAQLFRNAVNYMAGPVPHAGDVDLDGDVDMTDFNFIKNNFQKPAVNRAAGDLNGDLVVDWLDFRQWKTNFPFTPPPAAAASGVVPEPASAVLGVMASSVLLGVGRSIRRRCA